MHLYLTPTLPNVHFAELATVGDVVGTKPDNSDYRYVGIPDGLGAIDNGNGTFTVFSNHELGATSGVVREHGSKGAFISAVTFDTATLQAIGAEDAIKTVVQYNETTETWFEATTAFNRFCSSDLADTGAFYFGGLGTMDRIYLTGEEAGTEGRAFGVVLSGDDAGKAFELDYLGNLSFENAVASPFAQEKTIVVSTDDATPGEVYFYIGEKQASGNAVEKAGLVGGDLYGLKVDGLVQNELSDGLIPASGSFSLVNLGDVSDKTGATIDAESAAAGVTDFLRPEDAAWDPNNPNVLYFVTTTTPARLIRLTFEDITNPALGGEIEVLVDGTVDPVNWLDNITVSDSGIVFMQEDPGSSTGLAKVWAYDPAGDVLTQVGEHNAAFFAPGAPQFLTTNEESSGIIDVTEILGDGDTQAFLLDVQAHYGIADAELVEGGQLLAMFVDDLVLNGGNGKDTLVGTWANEIINGGNGKDLLDGGSGNDELDGGNGKDVLIGGAGNDVLTGGLAGDWFVFDNTGETGKDVITDLGHGDLILVTEQLDAGDLALTDETLALFGFSSVEIVGVSALEDAGLVAFGGTVYHAYEIA